MPPIPQFPYGSVLAGNFKSRLIANMRRCSGDLQKPRLLFLDLPSDCFADDNVLNGGTSVDHKKIKNPVPPFFLSLSFNAS